MPQKANKQAQEREGRLLIAMDAYKKGQFPSIRAAALMYRVNPDTL